MDNKTIGSKNVLRMSNLCRACLTESNNMISLNDYFDDEIEVDVSPIWQLLYKVTNIKIPLDNRLPSQICSVCMKLAKDFYEFKSQFEKSQEILNACFKQELVENDSLISVVDFMQESSDVNVELISKQGKFDLKDVFIVEQEEEQDSSSFEGFLGNLGTVVSASFVNNKHSMTEGKQISFIGNDSISESTTNKFETILVENQNQVNLQNTVKIVNLDSDENVPVERKFANETQLKLHSKKKHEKQTFICEICGILLKSRSSRYHHMVKHGGKKYICPLCDKSYSNSSGLQLHITAVHKNSRTHLCTICGKQFNYGNALTYHMRIHTDERKYKCTYCDRSFRMQCGLERHLRTHTGIRPYKCSYCENAFRSKGEVDCHEMTHTGYRPYHCKYCNKGFTKTYNLKLHLLGHKGQHSCTKCARTFIELQLLNIHMQSSHSRKGIIDEDNPI